MEGCNIEEEQFGFCKEHMPIRKCRDCEEVKPLTEYYSYKRKLKSGKRYTFHKPECKPCAIKINRKWQYDHYEEFKESLRKYNKKPEHKRKKRILEQKRREQGTLREWQRNNRDKVKGYNETRRHKNHSITKDEWELCKEYFDYECAYCGIKEDVAKELYGNYLHKEHVDHEGLGDLSNCVPSCKVCNASKHIYTLYEWYPMQTFYVYERYEKIQQWLSKDYKLYISDFE